VRIVAPAEVTFSAACNMNLQHSAVVRAIFKGRELILGSEPEERPCPLGLVAQATVWGWGLLAEEPGREIVFGAATQPWLANPVFRALPPDEFKTSAQVWILERVLYLPRLVPSDAIQKLELDLLCEEEAAKVVDREEVARVRDDRMLEVSRATSQAM